MKQNKVITICNLIYSKKSVTESVAKKKCGSIMRESNNFSILLPDFFHPSVNHQ